MSLAIQRNTGALAAKKNGAMARQAPINFSGTGSGATAPTAPTTSAPVAPASASPLLSGNSAAVQARGAGGMAAPAGAVLGANLNPRPLNPPQPVAQNQEPVRRPFNMGNAEWAAQARASMPRTLQRAPNPTQPSVLNPVAGWTRGGAGTAQGSIQDTARGAPLSTTALARLNSQSAAGNVTPADQSTLNNIAADPNALANNGGLTRWEGGSRNRDNVQVLDNQNGGYNASVLAPNTTNMVVGGAGSAQGSVQGLTPKEYVQIATGSNAEAPPDPVSVWNQVTGMGQDQVANNPPPDPLGITNGKVPGSDSLSPLAFDAGRYGIKPLVDAGAGMSKTVNEAMDQYKKDQGIDQIEQGYGALQDSGAYWMNPERAAAANRAAEQGLETSVNNQRDAQVRQMLDMQNRGGRTGSGSLQGAYTSAANAISEGKRGLTQDAFGRDLEASKTGAAQMSAALEAKYGIKRDTSVSPEDFIQMLMEYVPDIADSLTPG